MSAIGDAASKIGRSADSADRARHRLIGAGNDLAAYDDLLRQAFGDSEAELPLAAVHHLQSVGQLIGEAIEALEHAHSGLLDYVRTVLVVPVPVTHEPGAATGGRISTSTSSRADQATPSSITLPNAEAAVIPEAKVTGYALNPDHWEGRDKARVFASALGFDRSNHDDLTRQIRRGALDRPAVLGRGDEHGQRYTVDIPVQGPRGSAVVRTGWIVRHGEDFPRLATMFVR